METSWCGAKFSLFAKKIFLSVERLQAWFSCFPLGEIWRNDYISNMSWPETWQFVRRFCSNVSITGAMSFVFDADTWFRPCASTDMITLVNAVIGFQDWAISSYGSMQSIVVAAAEPRETRCGSLWDIPHEWFGMVWHFHIQCVFVLKTGRVIPVSTHSCIHFVQIWSNWNGVCVVNPKAPDLPRWSMKPNAACTMPTAASGLDWRFCYWNMGPFVMNWYGEG